ncbi:MAG TPA: hypothetical protein VHN78_05700 [Chloroflexota bacterium]|nr:hypothetical protein [Chloroflexota bacterium]
MSETGEARFVCRNCGRTEEGERPPHGLCRTCRAAVVRRSTVLAVLPALALAALYVWLLSFFDMWESRFMIVWIALGVALVWFAFKVARRVLFDVVRSRGVKVSGTA